MSREKTPFDWRSELSAIAGAIDWRELLRRSDLARQVVSQPETYELLQSVQKMRGPMVRAAVQHGLLTEEEARPVNEGGLGVIEIVQRLIRGDIPARVSVEKVEKSDE